MTRDTNRAGERDRRRTLADDFTSEEWTRFFEAAQRWASEQGGTFMLDESIQFQGPRRWAAYIRSTMQTVGVDDLAARIDPAAYAPGDFEVIAALGKRRPIDS